MHSTKTFSALPNCQIDKASSLCNAIWTLLAKQQKLVVPILSAAGASTAASLMPECPAVLPLPLNIRHCIARLQGCPQAVTAIRTALCHYRQQVGSLQYRIASFMECLLCAGCLQSPVSEGLAAACDGWEQCWLNRWVASALQPSCNSKLIWPEHRICDQTLKRHQQALPALTL